MARTRMIKPEIWDNEKLDKISRDARLLFVGLWSNYDDYDVVKVKYVPKQGVQAHRPVGDG